MQERAKKNAYSYGYSGRRTFAISKIKLASSRFVESQPMKGAAMYAYAGSRHPDCLSIPLRSDVTYITKLHM